MKYIVEHLESDVHDWCLLEYKHMIMQVGADNLIISHLDEDLIRRGIPQSLANAHCTSETVEALAFPKHQIVLLDPSSTEDLKPEDAQIFKYALFGGAESFVFYHCCFNRLTPSLLGILGDDPPKDRTKELRVKGFATRNLGPVQMTTDTAVLVAKLVLEDGKA